MRLATTMLASITLACPAWADDATLYRRIRFGHPVMAGRMSACSMQFGIGFHDPSAPPQRDGDIDGEITFSRRDGRLSDLMTMRAFGDHTTKPTRRLVLPFSPADEGSGADDGLAGAGRVAFDDCMATLARNPG